VHCIETICRSALVLWVLALAACAGQAPAPTAAPASARHAPSKEVSAAPAGQQARNMKEYQRLAAQRLVSANPQGTYLTAPPDVLLAIPVLGIELNANGSVKRIEVMRYPGQAPETTQMAIDAVRRAAPFGDVSHLPKPWKITEVFLFREDRRFKPRTLDD
jgi:hypothetical protein